MVSNEEILLAAPADKEQGILSKHGNLRIELLKYEDLSGLRKAGGVKF